MVFEGFLELRINIDLVFIHLMKLYPFTQEHTMIGYRDNLYVFGGEVGFSNGVETPLWIYNITVRTKYDIFLHNELVCFILIPSRLFLV